MLGEMGPRLTFLPKVFFVVLSSLESPSELEMIPSDSCHVVKRFWEHSISTFFE